jgi:hypothetical protein
VKKRKAGRALGVRSQALEPFRTRRSWPTSVGWEVVDRRAEGEIIGRIPVVVLEELGQVIARLSEVCRNHGEIRDVRSSGE